MRAILDHVLIAPSVTSAILVLLHSPCVVGSDSTSAQVAEEQTRFNPLGLLRPLDPTTCAIPVDDSTAAQTGSWEPWTHPPFCVTSVSSSPGAKESHDHVGNRHKVCLFTDTRFRGGAGLSAITTPEIAASLAPKLMDPYVSWEEPKHSFRTGPIVGSADAGNETTTPPPPPYHIVPVPGRGQGVVALRRIRRAEVFMVGVPAVLVATTTPAVAMVVEGVDHQDGRQWRGLLEEAFERLPCRDALMALARSAGHGTPAEDVLRTNMFTIPVEGLAHQGLFLEISRINHACKPNSVVRFSSRTLTMEVVAIQDVEPGEELTISYVSESLPYDVRRQAIRDNWGFDCSCAHCSRPPVEIAASDRRRQRIATVTEALSANDRSVAPDTAHLLRLADEMLAIVEAEGLSKGLGEYYLVLAQGGLNLGDLATARRFGALALESWVRFQGFDHEQVPPVRALLRELDDLALSVQAGEKTIGIRWDTDQRGE